MNILAQQLEAHLRPARHSETLLNNELANTRAANSLTVYRLGFGQSPFPVPSHVVEAMRAAVHRKEYSQVQGLPELRHAIADFHNALEGHNWRAEELVVGSGSKILLFCLLAALSSADVALPTPSWVSYEPQAALAGHRVMRIQTRGEDGWQLTPEKLDQFCAGRSDRNRPLLLILNYPGNPVGRSYDPATLEQFARICHSYGVIVISDEIYGLLHHQGAHRSVADYYPEGTVVSTGLSKWCGAGGWRLGVVRIPPELGEDYFQRVLGIASETYSSTSTPAQLAAIAAYQHNSAIREYLSAQRSILGEIGNECTERLRRAGVHVSEPEGGFYLFPDFSPFATQLERRGIVTSQAFTEQLLSETGVSLLAGSAFGMPAESLTARLAYVDFDGTAALQTGRPDAARLYQAIDKLCRWLVG